jgi:hypothetical protein
VGFCIKDFTNYGSGYIAYLTRFFVLYSLGYLPWAVDLGANIGCFGYKSARGAKSSDHPLSGEFVQSVQETS